MILATLLVLSSRLATDGRAQAVIDPMRAVGARSRVLATVLDSTFWPEGVDADPRNGKLYVASVRHRTIAEIDPAGGTRELLARDRGDLRSIFGVRVDTARNVLWATTSAYHQIPGYVPADSAIAALLEIRISDGTIIRRWDAPVAPGGRVLGDLAISPHGDVFLSDSNHPVMFWLHPGANTLDSIVSTHFRSLQGVAPTPDGRFVYLGDYVRGFYRVDLATRAVVHVEDPPGVSTRGCDGIIWYRGSIIAVQNGVVPPHIIRFAIDSAGTRFTSAEVIDQNAPVADEPTIAALRGADLVYVANSQWEKYDAHGKRIASKPLTAPILLALPLP
jgi:DNA-binding beta-propeller fold protein YncE